MWYDKTKKQHSEPVVEPDPAPEPPEPVVAEEEEEASKDDSGG